MTPTTILIKRNADRNYDKLFVAIERATILGRAESTGERETEAGYAVEFARGLDADVIAWCEGRPKDFEVVQG